MKLNRIKLVLVEKTSPRPNWQRNNLVVNYTLEQSIIDGVNVDNRIYRIKTRVHRSNLHACNFIVLRKTA